MTQLFSRRRGQHFLLLLKYWRLVFNDHFVIALFFMFGALAWGYSQALNQLNSHLWWSRPVAIIVLLIILQVGRLATLVKPADPVFLLPQAKMMTHYFHQALHYSLILGELMTLAFSAVLMPFIMATSTYTVDTVIAIAVVMVTLKATEMNWLLARLFRFTSKTETVIILVILPGVVLISGFYLSWIVAGIISTIVMVVSWQVQRRVTQRLLNWRLAVAQEQQRMLGIYRFFNLFTDVPMVQGVVHRRRYLDWLVKLMSQSKQPFSYLYARGFLRGTEVSGLIVRLTVVGMAILFFIPIFWLNLLIMVLFIYLLTVQLIPFYWHFDNHVFTHLYPVSQNDQLKNFQSLSQKILLGATLLLWLASTGTTVNMPQQGAKLLVGVCESLLLVYGYIKYRIRQKK